MGKPITETRIAELRALLNPEPDRVPLTPLPWFVFRSTYDAICSGHDKSDVMVAEGANCSLSDLKLIVGAVNALPDLLDEIEHLRGRKHSPLADELKSLADEEIDRALRIADAAST